MKAIRPIVTSRLKRRGPVRFGVPHTGLPRRFFYGACSVLTGGAMMGAPMIKARYWIETAFPLEYAAEMMAGEQSSGTFVRVPGETDELRRDHAARLERIRELDCVSQPSLPGAG